MYSGDPRLVLSVFRMEDFDLSTGGEPWAIADVADDDSSHGPDADAMFCVRIFPPSSRRLKLYLDKELPAVRILDSPRVKWLLAM